MNKEIAVRVDNVKKDFYLPHNKNDSIKQKITQFYKSNNKTEIQHTLKGISFDIKKGEFFGVVGRNGSGKSTLLKILAEIYKPTSGSITIKGSMVPFIELGVGFNQELTGRENVYLNGALLGFSRKEIDDRYKSIVDFAELEDFMDQRIKNYSSGMKVRLAFSVAIQADADILLLDEVLAVGDASFQRKCFEYFREIKKKNTTVIFVTHNMEQVREFCDRAVLIEKGVISDIGDSDDIAQAYTRLFTKGNISLIKNNDAIDKWGDGGVSINNTILGKEIYTRKDKKITVSFDVLFDDIEDKKIRIGISVRNQNKQILAGTNSQILKIDIPALKKGKIASYKWSVDNIFPEGEYKISLTAEDLNNGVFEWLNNAVSFRVESDIRTPYISQPDITLKKIGNKNVK